MLKIIRKFADDIVGSLQFSLKSVPENLIYVKMKCKLKFFRVQQCSIHIDVPACEDEFATIFRLFLISVVRQMSKMLKRRTSVNHLYQAATMVVNSSNTLYDKMVEASLN